MISSHFSIGNSSIGETNWMPALLTSTCTEPKVFSPSAIMPAISAGLVMSAGERTALTLKSLSIPERSRSISAGVPKPLSTILAPALAKARAKASPMPLVEPVTTAVLPDRLAIFSLLFDGAFFIREIVGHHGVVGLRSLQPVLVTHRQMDVARTGFPMFDHGDMGEIIVLGGRLVILALVDKVHHRDGVLLGGFAQQVHRRVVFQILRQPADQIANRLAGVVELPVLVGGHAR